MILIKKLIVNGLLVLIAVSGIGCGSTPTPDIPVQELAQSHGLLIGTINSKGAHGLELRSSKNKRVFIGTRGTILQGKYVSAWLEPGSYEILNFQVFNPLLNVINVEKEPLPKIEIKRGQVVDLNHIILHTLGGGKYSVISKKRPHSFVAPLMLNEPQIFNDFAYVSWELKNKIVQTDTQFGRSGQGVIADLILEYGRKQQNGEVSPILPSELSNEEAFEKVKSFGLPSTPLIVTDNGLSFFGTALGQVRYKKNEVWSYIDTGFVDAVTAINVAGLEKITVALESGAVLETTDFGLTWVEKYTLGDGQVVVDLRVIDSQLIATTLTFLEGYDHLNPTRNIKVTPKVSIYRLHGGRIELLHNKIFKKISSLNFYHTPPRIENIDNTLLVSMPYVDTLVSLNIDSSKGADLKLPSKASGMSVNKELRLITIWVAQGGFSKAFYSSDFGSTWEKLPKPPYQPRYIDVKSTTEAYMWHLHIGMNSAWYELEKMNAQKNKWVNFVKALPACIDILMDFKKEEHYCVLASGVLKTLKNDTWD